VQPAAWPSIPTPPEVITLAHFFPYCQEMVDVKIKSTMSQQLGSKVVYNPSVWRSRNLSINVQKWI